MSKWGVNQPDSVVRRSGARIGGAKTRIGLGEDVLFEVTSYTTVDVLKSPVGHCGGDMGMGLEVEASTQEAAQPWGWEVVQGWGQGKKVGEAVPGLLQR